MKFEIYKDGEGGFRWRLKAANGRIIADSGESYTKRAACLRGIALVKRSHGARTVELND